MRAAMAIWLAAMSRKGHLAVGEGVGDVAQDGIAELALDIRHAIGFARAAHLAVEGAGIREAVGVNAEAAQAHGAELLVTHGDGQTGTPSAGR